ncbi:solute carrier family 13 (sodium-dependent dicarboxylate transporter), member 2/3/5 [Desulfotomaculum arcticum]|uniref:Sodium-dependent dicarboxylate transporter SdcS n=1 Tax=Desulfotruncus arcticus DSM 17038 TaxID=1121424 RepID=A0A1I2QGZ5_9FIRM|nr:DASS family sodium-coupled anion symporter [Desulfotruncus arcticus]SFG26913.1 solute carrier family 13 (sodium-dependent dicarboxylate transporter), member 2/3/5 [Desulfotomaculum arcticum] [Desulfotruncus arcticus DSM 17038]
MGNKKILDLQEYKNKDKPVDIYELAEDQPRSKSGQDDWFKRIIAMMVERKWLLLGTLLLVFICSMSTPEGLTDKGKYAIALWAFVVVCFLTEALPLPVTAMVIGCYQVITGIAGFQEVSKSFMDDAVIFIMGVLMLGAMLVKYNIHSKVALFILKISGTRIDRVVLGMVTFCALSAGFITEHAAVTIMFPIGVGIVSLSGGIKKVPRLGKLMMLSIAYGVIIGGIATPSGGARNALMLSFLNNMGINMGYGQWILMAFPLTLIMIIIVTYWLLKLFKPEVKDLKDVMERIQQELDAGGPMTAKGIAAIAIFLAIVAGWVLFSRQYGVGNIAMIGVIVAAVLRLVDWNYLQQKTQWGVVVLYAGAVSMGKMLVTTGAAAWLAKLLLSGAAAIGISKGLPLLAATTSITALVTNTMADGPAVAVLGPVFIKAAELANTSPLAIGVATSLGSAFSYILVIATPANAIVYGPGFLKASDFLKAGSFLFIISLVLTIVGLAAIWWRVLGV